MRRLSAPKDVAALIRGLHPNIKRKIRAALAAILADPSTGKALREQLSGLRSYRVGRIRIIYREAPRKIIEIVAVGRRTTIHEETLRLIKRDHA